MHDGHDRVGRVHGEQRDRLRRREAAVVREVYDCEALVATFSAHAEAVAYVRDALLAALPR